MHPERGTAGERRATKLRRDALLVETVAAFVQRAEQPGREKVSVDAGGETHVRGGESGGERVRRAILAAAVEVEAEVLHNRDAEVPLTLLVVAAVERRWRVLRRRIRGGRAERLDDGHQLIA